MARQRFIWPTIWKDPVFGRLSADEQVLFIGLFSIADDEGRLLADPAYLRSELFAYRTFSLKKMEALRDSVVAKCANVYAYEAGGIEYIALRKWGDYQHPKYAKASRIPDPSLEESSAILGSQGWVGLDRDGLGWNGQGREGLDRDGAADAAKAGDKSPFEPPKLKEIA